MLSWIALVLVAVTSAYGDNEHGVRTGPTAAVPYAYSGSLKSASIVSQSNLVPASPTPKYYNVPQQASYVAVSSAVQPSSQYVSSPVAQPPQYLAPQAVPYVAVSTAQQATPYVAVSSASQQPSPYVGVSSVPQPSSFVGVSPKFLSAPVAAAPSVPVAVQPIPTAAIPVGVLAASPKFAQQAQVKSGIADKDAQIVNEGREVGYDGTFNYGFDTENGISVKSKGYIKPAASPTDEPIQVIEGSYTYFDVYGKPQTIQYIADENGYRAFGEAIPQPPEEILKTLAHRR